MDIDEAKDTLNHLIEIYEYYSGFEKNSNKYKSLIATKVLLEHLHNLEKEVSNLAIESINREKELAKLENKVEKYYEYFQANM